MISSSSAVPFWPLAEMTPQHLCSADPLADHYRAVDIDPVNLKHRLSYIETNRANFAHGRLPSLWLRVVAL